MTKTKGRGRLDGDVLITLYLHVNSNMLIYWSFHCIMAAVKIVWATAFRLSIRIEHFARQNPAGVRNYEKCYAEFAALRFMDRKGVCQFQRRRAFLLIGLPRQILVGKARL